MNERRKKQESTGVFYIGVILNRRISSNGKREYFIKWKDYSAAYNSWEPYENLKSAWDMIKEYDKKNPIDKSKSLVKSKSTSSKSKYVKKLKTIRKKSESLSVEASSSKKEKGRYKEKVVVEKKHSTQKTEKKLKVPTQVNQNNQIIVKADSDESSCYPCEPDYISKLDIHQDGKLKAQVKWINKTSSNVDYDAFKMKYPQKLIEFFESRIVFPFENVGTKKFLDMHRKKED